MTDHSLDRSKALLLGHPLIHATQRLVSLGEQWEKVLKLCWQMPTCFMKLHLLCESALVTFNRSGQANTYGISSMSRPGELNTLSLVG